MFKPIPGGSSQEIGFDDQYVTVHLPPVGKVIDKYDGTGELVDSEILFEEKPVPEQKWQRPELPEKWHDWLKEERQMQKNRPEWKHPDAEDFREREWKRRLNGVWMAIGNRDGKPSQYVYLTGLAYFYFAWWKALFGYPRFRFTYLKVFYLLAWAEECPWGLGVAFSTLRRYGKTAILGVFLYEYTSRTYGAFAGMQAQNDEEAQKKYNSDIVYPWKRLPEFFRPKYNYDSTQKEAIEFHNPPPKGKAALEYDPDKDDSLYSWISYKEASELAYDGEKLHRYGNEEPGKTIRADVYKRWGRVKPCFHLGPKKIGIAFLPTTIEEMEEGGTEFVKLFEDSFPSKMKANEDGSTSTGLIALFISALEGYIFDEYGRSVIEDPPPSSVVFDEDGERITEGAKTVLLRNRDKARHDPVTYAEEVRKYPWSWAEAKTSGTAHCLFNSEILTGRLDEISKMVNKPYVKGNLYPVDGKPDGKVAFKKDNHAGKFKFAWMPDQMWIDGKQSVINNVGFYDGYDKTNKKKRFYYPKNDNIFSLGGDPIRYKNDDDPSHSKAAFYGKWKFVLPKVFKNRDGTPGEDRKGFNSDYKIFNNNFFVQYLYRPPDFSIFGEDMIMLCRFLGCSILIEDNISSLRQYFDDRGYGDFCIYQADLNNELFADNPKDDKSVEAVPAVVDLYIRKLQTHVNNYGMHYCFEELIEDMLKFEIKKRPKHDPTVGAGFCLMADDIIIQEDDRIDDVDEWAEEYTIDGFNSVLAEDTEDNYAMAEEDDDDWEF